MKQRTKILMVAPYFPPEGGGLEKYVKEVSSRLQSQDVDVVIVTSSRSHGDDLIVHQDGVIIYKLYYDFRISNTPFSFTWFGSIRKIIKKEKPDLININMPVAGIGDVVAMVSGNIPLVVTYHSGSMKKTSSRMNCIVSLYENVFLPILFRKASTIISSSNFVSQSFLRKYNKSSRVVTPAVDGEFFKPDFTKRGDNQRVLFVAGLNKSERYKGLENLICAISEVKKVVPNIELSVVGGGDMLEEYKSMVKAKDLSESVFFHGKLTGEDLLEQYQKSNILVQSSINESFSMVVLEAMASSLVVVASNAGAIRDIIDDGVDGYIVSSNSPKEISEKIIEVVKDPSSVAIIGERARNKMLKYYSWDSRAKMTKSIFNLIISKKNPAKINFNDYNKIAIVGTSATGKTTLSKKIKNITGYDLFHMDDILRNKDFSLTSPEYYLPEHEKMIKGNKWIIEGYIDEDMKRRLDLADLIIYLDYSSVVCAARLLKRWVFFRKRNKEITNIKKDKEKISMTFFLRVLFGREKAELKYVLSGVDSGKIIRVKSPKMLGLYVGE